MKRSLEKLIFREADKVMQIKNNYDIEWVKDGEHSTGILMVKWALLEL